MRKFLFLGLIIISNSLCIKVYAENLGTRIYNNNGTYYFSEILGRGDNNLPGRLNTYRCSDSTCKSKSIIDWGDFNSIAYDKDGNQIGEYFYHNQRGTYIFDENNKLTSYRPCYSCAISANFQYTETGRVLIYDNNGNLTNAFNDFIDMTLNNRSVGNLSLISEDGNFYDTDKDGRAVGVYNQNGDVLKYKYDSGGNVLSAYKNGEQIYQRKIYTIEEADAATKKGNVNRLTITW